MFIPEWFVIMVVLWFVGYCLINICIAYAQHRYLMNSYAEAERQGVVEGARKAARKQRLRDEMLDHISPNKRQCCPSPYFNARRIVSSALRPRTGKPTHRAMF
jgi:hypothetical protein